MKWIKYTPLVLKGDSKAMVETGFAKTSRVTFDNTLYHVELTFHQFFLFFSLPQEGEGLGLIFHQFNKSNFPFFAPLLTVTQIFIQI